MPRVSEPAQTFDELLRRLNAEAQAPSPLRPEPEPAVLQPLPTPTAAPAPPAPASFDDLLRRLGTTTAVVPPAAAVAPRSLGGEFVTALERGVQTQIAGFQAAAGTAAAAFGAEETSQELLGLSQQRAEAAPPPTVAFENALDSPSNFVFFAASALGENIPFMASIILGGGIGGLTARLGLRLFGARALSSPAGAQFANQVIGRFGLVGAGATAATVEAGFTAQEQFAVRGAIVDPLTIGAAGLAKGTLEMLVPLAVARRFGLPVGKTGGLLERIGGNLDKLTSRPSRALKAALSVGAVEGATELLQEATDLGARKFIDENFKVLGPEAVARLQEATGTGALVGFILGGVAGGVGPRPAPQEPATSEQLRAALTETVADTEPGDVAPGVAPVAAPVLTDELLVQPTRRVTGLDEDLQEFLPPVEALIASARAERGGAGFSLARADRASLEGADVTATLTRLPSEITGETPGVRFADEGRSSAALLDAQLAVQDRNAALTERDPRNREKFLLGAEFSFARAVGQGFRFTPREGEGFVVVGKLPEEALVPVEATEAELPVTEGVVNILPSRLPGGRAAFPLGKEAALSLGLARRPAARAFAVNLGRVPQGSISAADLAGPLETEGRRPGVFSGLSVQEIVSAIEASDVFRFAEGMTETEKKRVALRIRNPGESSTDFSRTLLGLGLRAEPASAEDTVIVSEEIGLAEIERVLPAEALTEVPAAPEPSRRRLFQPGTFEVGDLVDLTTLDGKPYTTATHKLGTAVAVRSPGARPVSAAALRRLRRVEKFYTAMMHKLGMTDTRLVVFLNGLDVRGKMLTMGLDADGSTFYASDGSGAIGIGSGLTEDTALFETASHEFGHFLWARELTKAPPEVRAKILEAYNRALVRAALGNIGDLSLAFFPPVRVALGTLALRRDLPSLQAIQEGFTGKTSEYWFSFNEWGADQFARWVVGGVREPIDSVERFMQRLARKMKRLFETAAALRGFTPEAFKPSQAVEEFIRGLARRRTSELADLPQAAIAVGDDQAEVDATRRDTLGDGQATLRGAETVNTRRLVRSLNLSTTERARVERVEEAAARFTWYMRWGWNILQIADKNKHIRWMQDYVQVMRRWRSGAMNFMSMGDTTLRQWRQIGKEQGDSLGLFMFDLDAMVFRSVQEEKDNTLRQPTEEELVTLARRHKLSPAAFEQFLRVRQDLRDILDNWERLSVLEIRKTISDRVGQELEVAKIAEEFTALRSRPFFPHSRFGDFMVVVKDTEGRQVVKGGTAFAEQFVTQREAQTAVARIGRAFPAREGFTIGIDKIPEGVRVLQGVPSLILKRLPAKLRLTDQQKDWLGDLIAAAAPTRSFRKRLIHRKNIPGFSMDAMRSYADYIWHGSNYMARIEFGEELREILAAADENTTELRRAGADVVKRRRILEFLQEHLEHIMNPAPDWAQLRSAAFMWWLGFSPMSAVLNLTQIPMVAFPYLGNRFGTAKAAAALTRSSIHIRQLYMAPQKRLPAISDLKFKAVDIGIRQGFLEESFATEVAGVAEGGNLRRLLPGTTGMRWFVDFTRLGAAMFQTSEKVNRRIVFEAAFDLGLENPNAPHLLEMRDVTASLDFNNLVQNEGLGEQEALAFLAGRDAVERTQFEYATFARPAFMRGRKGVIFTFFMFLQNMAWFTLNSPGNVRFLVMMLAMGGLMGLPGAEDLSAMAKLIARRVLGKDFDVEREVRRLVVNVTGEDSEVPPDIFLYGASRVGFGMPAAFDLIGVPFPSFDISANIGLGQIIPGVAEVGPPGRDFEARFARISTDIAGATFGVGINWLKALSDDSLPWHDFKRWERAMPRAFGNVAKAARFHAEGLERTRTGATVVEFDPTDTEQLLEIIAQAAGFRPTRLARKWDRAIALRDAENFWTARRAMLLAQFDHALTVGDREAKVDMLDAIRRYNRSVPFAGLAIARGDLVRSRKARARGRRRFEAGRPGARRLQPIATDIQRLFPEAQEEEVLDEPAPRG